LSSRVAKVVKARRLRSSRRCIIACTSLGRSCLALLSLTSIHCSEPLTRTTVDVLIDADSEVREQVVSLEASVEARPTSGAGWRVLQTRHIDADPTTWPFSFRVSGVDESSSPTLQLIATGRDNRGSVLVQARVTTTLPRARRFGLRTLFENACLGRTELCGASLTCSKGDCVSAELDPEASKSATSMRSDPSVAAPNDTAKAQPDPSGVAKEGDPCSTPDERRCASLGSDLPLRCDGTNWQRQPECTESQRCDTSAGSTRGTCQPIARECMGKQAGVPFCDSEVMYQCNADLLASDIKPCNEHEHCQPDGKGSGNCACRPGYVEHDTMCVEPPDCDTDNGGCDKLTDCIVQNGARTCTVCPSGWSGDGMSGCTPSLSSLEVANAELTPKFDPNVVSYRVRVPLLAQRLSVTATAPPEAGTAFNGVTIEAGKMWPSPVLSLGENDADIVVSSTSGLSKTYHVVIERDGVEEAHIKASNSMPGQQFGQCVAASGDTLIVAAPFDSGGAKGINGDLSAPAAANSGAVFVFVHRNGVWTQQAYLKPNNAASGDYFGVSLAISGDTIFVGTPRQNTAAAVSTATRPGSVFVFTRANDTWSQTQELTPADVDATDAFGISVDVDVDTMVAGAFNDSVSAGAAYVYSRSGSTWTQKQRLTPRTRPQLGLFGSMVKISGDTLAIAAQEDSEDVYRAGAVYLFQRMGDQWIEKQRITADPPSSGAQFGWAIALRGDTLLAGSPQLTEGNDKPGDVRVFERTNGEWAQTAVMTNPVAGQHDGYGVRIALAEDALLIGAYAEGGGTRGLHGDPSVQGLSGSGAAYLYSRTSEGWKLSTYLKASNPGGNAHFGIDVALTPERAYVGAYADSSGGKGIDPQITDERSDTSGGVYVFQ
jgi:hypothetical protein